MSIRIEAAAAALHEQAGRDPRPWKVVRDDPACAAYVAETRRNAGQALVWRDRMTADFEKAHSLRHRDVRADDAG